MAQEPGEAGAASSPWKQPESCRSRRAAGCAGPDAQLIAKRGPAKRPNADSGGTGTDPLMMREVNGKAPESCCILENPEKIWSKFINIKNLAKFWPNLRIFCKKSANISAIFNETFEIKGRCNGVHRVDLGASFSNRS